MGGAVGGGSGGASPGGRRWRGGGVGHRFSALHFAPTPRPAARSLTDPVLRISRAMRGARSEQRVAGRTMEEISMLDRHAVAPILDRRTEVFIADPCRDPQTLLPHVHTASPCRMLALSPPGVCQEPACPREFPGVLVLQDGRARQWGPALRRSA